MMTDIHRDATRNGCTNNGQRVRFEMRYDVAILSGILEVAVNSIGERGKQSTVMLNF